jgi:hypothetical protein
LRFGSGHESVETTQIYLDADLALKEQALAKTNPVKSTPKTFSTGRRVARLPQTTLIPALRTMPPVERTVRKQSCILTVSWHLRFDSRGIVREAA